MPTLLLQTDTGSFTLPLAAATLLGRGAACLVRIDDPAVPAHWLELRWRGDGWAWRALAGEDRTRGTGAFLEGGWRRMDAAEGRGTRVSIGSVTVELVDASPPAPFVLDLVTGRAVDAAELDTLVEVRGDTLLPIGVEGDVTQALADGACWIHPVGPRMLRAHVPTLLVPTFTGRLDLSPGGVVAECDIAEGTLVLRRGDVQVEVRGSCVRALAAYDAAGPEGWMTAADAWCRWVELGGSGSAPVDAVAWERGRIRRLLHDAGVAGLEGLVERRKVGSYVQTRLGACIARLIVHTA